MLENLINVVDYEEVFIIKKDKDFVYVLIDIYYEIIVKRVDSFINEVEINRENNKVFKVIDFNHYLGNYQVDYCY